jgi:hypothetical protein
MGKYNGWFVRFVTLPFVKWVIIKFGRDRFIEVRPIKVALLVVVITSTRAIELTDTTVKL